GLRFRAVLAESTANRRASLRSLRGRCGGHAAHSCQRGEPPGSRRSCSRNDYAAVTDGRCLSAGLYQRDFPGLCGRSGSVADRDRHLRHCRFFGSRRTKEIGIRMAIGAEANGILAMILREGMTVMVLGVVAGLGLSVAATGLVRHLLYG